MLYPPVLSPSKIIRQLAFVTCNGTEMEWAQDDQGYSTGPDAPHILYPETQRTRRPDCDPSNKAAEAQGDMQDDASKSKMV